MKGSWSGWKEQAPTRICLINEGATMTELCRHLKWYEGHVCADILLHQNVLDTIPEDRA